MLYTSRKREALIAPAYYLSHSCQTRIGYMPTSSLVLALVHRGLVAGYPSYLRRRQVKGLLATRTTCCDLHPYFSPSILQY
jgi:hypothetical protein